MTALLVLSMWATAAAAAQAPESEDLPPASAEAEAAGVVPHLESSPAPEPAASVSGPAAAPEPSAGAPQGSEPPAAAPALPTTVVFGFGAHPQVPEESLVALNEALVFELSRLEGRRVLGPEDIRGLLELEAQRALAGCDSKSCLADIAAALDADRVVQGTLHPVGAGWLMILTELDGRRGVPLGRVQRRLVKGDVARLLPQLRALVGSLDELQRSGASSPTGVLVVETEPPAEVILDGHSYGESPVVIEDAPVGRPRLQLVSEEGDATFPIAIYEDEATTVEGTFRTTPDGTGEADFSLSELSFWIRSAGAGVTGLGALACCLAPVSGCLVPPLVAAVGWFDSGQASPGAGLPGAALLFAMSTVVPALASIPLLGVGGFVWWWGGGEAPELELVHRFEVAPPAGRGDVEEILLDAGGDETASLAPFDKRLPTTAMAH